MWVDSPIEFEITYGNVTYKVGKGITEIPDDAGRAYFLYDYNAKSEQNLYDALQVCVRRHGKSQMSIDDMKLFISQFKVGRFKKELEPAESINRNKNKEIK